MSVNVSIEKIDGKDHLKIVLPIEQGKVSTSGKTFIVAGTGGFMKTEAKVQGKEVSISVNATIKKD